MPHAFYELPIYLALVLVFMICNAISGLGYFVAHKFLSRVDNRDMVTKVVWQTVLFFSTIFITFWIATNWNNLGVLKQTTVREANSLELLYYDLNGLARSDKVVLENQLNNYINLVINDEYPSLQKGERSAKTTDAFQGLVHAIYHYAPEETLSDENSYTLRLSTLDFVVL
jgi:hypothetical protein